MSDVRFTVFIPTVLSDTYLLVITCLKLRGCGKSHALLLNCDLILPAGIWRRSGLCCDRTSAAAASDAPLSSWQLHLPRWLEVVWNVDNVEWKLDSDQRPIEHTFHFIGKMKIMTIVTKETIPLQKNTCSLTTNTGLNVQIKPLISIIIQIQNSKTFIAS